MNMSIKGSLKEGFTGQITMPDGSVLTVKGKTFNDTVDRMRTAHARLSEHGRVPRGGALERFEDTPFNAQLAGTERRNKL